MAATEPITVPKAGGSHSPAQDGAGTQTYKSLVSLIVPAYNEASIVEKNLTVLYQYMQSLEDEYRWEIIVVDDGSTDGTGELVEAFAHSMDNIRVLHHEINFGLGQAFLTAFNVSRADYIITLDVDLSYSPDHIRALLAKIREAHAKVVVASPYMDGGRVANVPWLRRTLSKWANGFLSHTAKNNLSTLTGMVRAYDRKFLNSLHLRSMGMEINPEIIYKAMLLHARVEEIPAVLDWHSQKISGVPRRSSMKLLRHTLSVLLSGFLFRPVMFFLIPGFTLLLFAVYVSTWMLIHFFTAYRDLAHYTWVLDRSSAAVAVAYGQFPHTFIVAGLASMLAIQLISLGVLALQSKSYFEEIFSLNTAIYRAAQKVRETEHE